MCRFGRQSLSEMMGRHPTRTDLLLFQAALKEILDIEYAASPPELRHED